MCQNSPMATANEESKLAANADPKPPRVCLGDLVVDLERESVYRRGKRIDLPVLSFRLLAAMIRESPHGLRTDALASATWGETAVSDETVRRRVHLLRKALAEDCDGTQYIATDRGRGYRLLVEVSPAEASDERAAPPRQRRFKWLLASLLASALVVASAAMVWRRADSPPQIEAAQIVRVVVNTPRYLSDPSWGFLFAENLQRQLMAGLSQHPNLELVPEDWIVGDAEDAQALEALEIDAVVRGTIQIRFAPNSADVFQVQVVLDWIDLHTSQVIWARTFLKESESLGFPALQAEIGRAVVRELTAEVVGVPGDEPNPDEYSPSAHRAPARSPG